MTIWQRGRRSQPCIRFRSCGSGWREMPEPEWTPTLAATETAAASVGSLIQCYEAHRHALCDRLGAVERTQFSPQPAEVEVDGAFGHRQLVSDVGAGHSARGKLEAIAFALRE